MEKATIQSRVLKTENIQWRSLKFLQDDDFKVWVDQGDEKLLASIIKYQFIDPFKVWEHEGVLYCLDGKHRYSDLEYAEAINHDIPDLLPAIFIDCKDRQEAAEMVLVYSSAYAKITQDGLFNFVSKFDLDIKDVVDHINIPEFSMERFEQKFDIFGTQAPEDVLPEDPEEIIVKPGDVFQLNEHRIVCGSFTDVETVQLLLHQSKARFINCDTPYNLPTGFFSGTHKKDFAMGAGEMSDEEFVLFLAEIMKFSVEHSVPGAIHYIFMDFRHSWHMTEAARRVYGNPEPKQICV